VQDFFLIAKVISLFGKDGYVKVESFSDFPQRFFELNEVYIDFWGEKKKLVVDDVKQLKNAFALKFKNFDDERSSRLLIERNIFVSESDKFKLPGDTYYVHDLIGSKVFRNDELLGTITEVVSQPANDILVIKVEGREELLLPFVLDFIEQFDPGKKILVLKKDTGYYDED